MWIMIINLNLHNKVSWLFPWGRVDKCDYVGDEMCEGRRGLDLRDMKMWDIKSDKLGTYEDRSRVGK